MFGKKKEPGIPVMHYEGISAFATDYPCRLLIQDETLIIKRLKPETTVTLPMNRVSNISAMGEAAFMLKYHGQAASTAKAKGIAKYYLVITYDKGMIALWGTASEYKEFLKLQYGNSAPAPETISL